MYFLDKIAIVVKSGDGGHGIVSFRREKNIAYGGPDGGNGGDGGDIIIRAQENLTSFIHFKSQRHFYAYNGKNGQKSNKTGKRGNDLFIEVPLGTQIFLEHSSIALYNMSTINSIVTFIKGGKGGVGNTCFKSSIIRSPRNATKGLKRYKIVVNLNLRLIANIGLLGCPNAGKSTLLSCITAAKAKVASYPFSTLIPQLGVIEYENGKLVIADVPGLIENSSIGEGLGIRFLKHLDKCNLLLHVVDISVKYYMREYYVICHEIEKFSTLKNKNKIIVLSKIDLVKNQIIHQAKKQFHIITGRVPLIYSNLCDYSIFALKKSLPYKSNW